MDLDIIDGKKVAHIVNNNYFHRLAATKSCFRTRSYFHSQGHRVSNYSCLRGVFQLI